MKSIQIKNFRPFRYKSVAVIALTSCISLSASYSFGVSIGLSYGSSSPNCSGSVNVEGAVVCGNCEGSEPAVTVANNRGGGGSASTDVICLESTWTGTWGPATVSVKKGINILTASDPCGSSDGLMVTSSGPSGAGFRIDVSSLGCSGTCGAKVKFTFTCLEDKFYQWHEDVTGDCAGFFLKGTASLLGPGEVSLDDYATVYCPGVASGSCISTQLWTLKEEGTGKLVASGTTFRTRSWGASSSSVIVTGDSIIGSGAACPP